MSDTFEGSRTVVHSIVHYTIVTLACAKTKNGKVYVQWRDERPPPAGYRKDEVLPEDVDEFLKSTGSVYKIQKEDVTAFLIGTMKIEGMVLSDEVKAMPFYKAKIDKKK